MRFFFFLVILLSAAGVSAQQEYRYSLNLQAVVNDRLTVQLETPRIGADSVFFHLPKIVPGTYAIHNYGSYVQELQAFDARGTRLTVERRDKNSWLIRGARKLTRIRYQVDDSWDSPEIKEDIFEPAGSNIQKDSLYILNTFAFFGYFRGMETLPVRVRVERPASLYGSTSLKRVSVPGAGADVFTAANYHELADAPIMYAPADTASLRIGGTRIEVAIYSPGKVLRAEEAARELLPVLRAQAQYLKGTLPVDRYAFLIYLSDNRNLTRYGALEHSYSSFYYLPEFFAKEDLLKNIRDVAAHEFFHIITPLNIHSREIGSFNYIDPQMSQHLWLYEGLTEYAAHHAQVKGGLIDRDEYIKRQAQKINDSRRLYNDTLPFTDLSRYTLTTYKNEYGNVYQKGALIGLSLDILLRNWSGGRYGTQELMADLSRQYGKGRSFEDSALFTEIGKRTDASIERFLKTYVAGSRPLPYDSIFRLVGIDFNPADTIYKPEIGFNFGMQLVPGTDTLVVAGMEQATKLGKRIGLLPGDKIIQFNGKPFNITVYADLFQAYSGSVKAGDTVSWTVLRKNSQQVWEQKELKTTIQLEPEVQATLKWQANPTPQQLALRNSWLSPAASPGKP